MNQFARKTNWIAVSFTLGFILSGCARASADSAGGFEAGVTSVSAAEPVAVRLRDLIAEAEERNPEIEAARAEWLAQKKKILGSWALPDPMAGLDVMGEMTETRVGPQDSRFMVSQKIPNPLKLWERRQVAKRAADAAKQQYLAVRRDVLKDLKRAYYDLYWVDASIEVIEEIHGLLKKFENVAQARYSNLSGAQRDVAKAQAEVSLTLEQLFRFRQSRASITAFLTWLLNRSPLEAIGKAEKPELPQLNETFPELIELARSNRQEIQEMEAMVEKRKGERKLSWLEYVPDINVGFTYTVVGGGTTMSSEDGKDSWMFPLSINVPYLWQNKRISEIGEAQKKLEAARARLVHAKNQTFYETKDAHVRYDAASEIALLYETAVIPQAKLALSSDQAGYEAGTMDFLNLLDSERVFLNAKLTYVKIYTEALRSYADLERATGLDLIGGEQ